MHLRVRVCDCEGMQHSDTLLLCSAGLLFSCKKKKAQQTRKNSHKPPSGQKSNTHGQINAGNTDLRLHCICFTAFNALLYVPTWQQAASERVHGKDLELGKCTFRVARDSGSESVTGRTPRLVPRQQPRPTAAAKEAGLLGLMATK